MPDPNPLTLGLIPPQLRAQFPESIATAAYTPAQAMAFVEKIVRALGNNRRLPIHVKVIKDNGKLAIHVEPARPRLH
jgi:hypothetical protein